LLPKLESGIVFVVVAPWCPATLLLLSLSLVSLQHGQQPADLPQGAARWQKKGIYRRCMLISSSSQKQARWYNNSVRKIFRKRGAKST